MKIKTTLWAIALLPATFLMAETAQPASQARESAPTEQTVTIRRHRRAGGVKRGLQARRPRRESAERRGERDAPRRRAGGVKSRRL